MRKKTIVTCALAALCLVAFAQEEHGRHRPNGGERPRRHATAGGENAGERQRRAPENGERQRPQIDDETRNEWLLDAAKSTWKRLVDMRKAINQTDILYMTRIQKERFSDLREYEQVKNIYTLRNAMLAGTKDNLRVLHPLPRVNEIDYDVDDSPKAYYFQQAQNGLYAREAIICRMLNIDLK